jgi:hypothetical protein
MAISFLLHRQAARGAGLSDGWFLKYLFALHILKKYIYHGLGEITFNRLKERSVVETKDLMNVKKLLAKERIILISLKMI